MLTSVTCRHQHTASLQRLLEYRDLTTASVSSVCRRLLHHDAHIFWFFFVTNFQQTVMPQHEIEHLSKEEKEQQLGQRAYLMGSCHADTLCMLHSSVCCQD